jgi:hypothetical protein
MSTWQLSTKQKKSALEIQFWWKDGRVIIREEGYRWGKFYCESDERPDVDLANPDGFLLDSDWELDYLDDGCWSSWEFPDDMSDEERKKIQDAWDAEFYEGMDELGWSNDDTEFWFHGPLLLEKTD